jgi:uncharacterized protein YndB with AHSA1/START domain
MGHEFEDVFDLEVDASIDDVWHAIATGPGIDSWFMGRNEVADGVVHTVFADLPITESEPGKRFAYVSPTAPDGRFIAYDFLIEGRAGGSTSIRVVASGFLPQEDWADEYFAMTRGHALFLRTLIEYLTFFAGRDATPVSATSPEILDWDRAWAALATELGLDHEPRVGDQVTLTLADRDAIDGTVYFVNEHTLGVRGPDTLYRFLRGLDRPMLAMHHVFAAVDVAGTEALWKAWLNRVFA